MKTFFTILLCIFITDFVFSQGLALPYYTGFDSPSEQAGWQQYRTGFLSLSDWGMGGGNAVSPPNTLAHDYNVGGSSSDTVVDWFVSPALNFTSAGQISLKVYPSGFSTPFPDSFEIWFGTDNPNPATGNFVLVGNLSYMMPRYVWLDTTINIPFSSDSGYIALKYKTIGAYWSTYSIDNITIDIPTSIKDNSMKTELEIFPNPVKSIMNIRINSNDDSKVILYNSLGEKIIERPLNNKINALDLSAYSNGIYYYMLTSNIGMNKTGKIMKQ